jgi:hypothetical protein
MAGGNGRKDGQNGLNRAVACMFALALAQATLITGVGDARADERPVINDASVYVRGGVVHCDLRCGNLFTERVVGTVESGLPAVVELLYTMHNADGKRVRRGLHSYELVYDVWDDVYSLDRGDTLMTFDGFDALRAAMERLQSVAVAPVADLDPQASYTVDFSIAVHPLRGAEEEQIVGWVDEQVLGQSSRSWHERVLNVGDLIHGIFSRDQDHSVRSEWYRTAAFTPSTLRHDRSGRRVARPLEVARVFAHYLHSRFAAPSSGQHGEGGF